MNWITRYFVSSFLLLLCVIIVVLQFWLRELCPSDSSYYSICFAAMIPLATVAVYGSILTVPVLFTLPFSTRVFDAWKKFMIGAAAVFIVLFATLAVLGTRGNAFIGDMGYGAVLLIIPVALYYVISIIIIAVSAVKEHKIRAKITK